MNGSYLVSSTGHVLGGSHKMANSKHVLTGTIQTEKLPEFRYIRKSPKTDNFENI
jgi:hypothetical protein